MDQDNQAAFINSFYEKLQPKQGPNTLKHTLSRLIVDYAIENTDFHLIVCNSNRSKKGRLHLLEELFHTDEFVRILVHFDIPDDILHKRVVNSRRSTAIFRAASTFEEVLFRQQNASQSDDIVAPTEGEADHLFNIKDNAEADSVIKEIVHLSECL